MARYIDADLLYKEIEKKIKANHEYRMAVVYDEFLNLINDAFTEDVVPRAEVEKIFAEIDLIFRKSLIILAGSLILIKYIWRK